MNRRYVYVIAAGERGEGQTPTTAHTTLAEAKAEVFLAYDLVPYQLQQGRWRASLNGVDEIWIYRMPLKGGGS